MNKVQIKLLKCAIENLDQPITAKIYGPYIGEEYFTKSENYTYGPCFVIDDSPLVPDWKQEDEKATPELIKEIQILERLGLLKTSHSYCSASPLIEITKDGINFLNKPHWFIKSLAEARDKLVVNLICYLLGVITVFIFQFILGLLSHSSNGTII